MLKRSTFHYKRFSSFKYIPQSIRSIRLRNGMVLLLQESIHDPKTIQFNALKIEFAKNWIV